MNDRKPSVVLSVTMFLAATVLLYPVSFGPAVWLSARGSVDTATLETIYFPIIWAAVHGPASFQNATEWWGSFGVPAGKAVVLSFGESPPDPDGSVCLGLNILIFNRNVGAL